VLQQDGQALVARGGMAGTVAHAWRKERVVDTEGKMIRATFAGGSLPPAREISCVDIYMINLEYRLN
jgi:hypothetical protein